MNLPTGFIDASAASARSIAGAIGQIVSSRSRVMARTVNDIVLV